MVDAEELTEMFRISFYIFFFFFKFAQAQGFESLFLCQFKIIYSILFYYLSGAVVQIPMSCNEVDKAGT